MPCRGTRFPCLPLSTGMPVRELSEPLKGYTLLPDPVNAAGSPGRTGDGNRCSWQRPIPACARPLIHLRASAALRTAPGRCPGETGYRCSLPVTARWANGGIARQRLYGDDLDDLPCRCRRRATRGRACRTVSARNGPPRGDRAGRNDTTRPTSVDHRSAGRLAVRFPRAAATTGSGDRSHDAAKMGTAVARGAPATSRGWSSSPRKQAWSASISSTGRSSSELVVALGCVPAPGHDRRSPVALRWAGAELDLVIGGALEQAVGSVQLGPARRMRRRGSRAVGRGVGPRLTLAGFVGRVTERDVVGESRCARGAEMCQVAKRAPSGTPANHAACCKLRWHPVEAGPPDERRCSAATPASALWELVAIGRTRVRLARLASGLPVRS